MASTQLLRGQDPAEATDRIKDLVHKTFFSMVQEPAANGADTDLDQQASSPDSQSTETVDATLVPATEVFTFAADNSNSPNLELSDQCQQAGISTGSTVIGDKIQFRLFAKVGVPKLDADTLSTASAASVTFERLDLSGIYDVAEDGTAALPLIGRIALAGRTLACVEAVVASAVAAQDTSVSSVTASFAARLPITVSGAVNAPGSYSHTTGMTVKRLLSLAGATFNEGPITPQEFESLSAQRDEILHRQLVDTLEMGRLQANLQHKNSIDLSGSVATKVSSAVVSPLLEAETLALQQDLSVDRMTDNRNMISIAGLRQSLEDTLKQLDLTETQIATLQMRHDEMSSFKARGLMQSSQLDLVQSNLMELMRIKMQLVTDQSTLVSQIKLAEEDAQLTIQLRQQDLSRRAATLASEIGLFDVQIAAIEQRLAKHGIGSEGERRALPLFVSVQRSTVEGANSFDATLDTLILPGDMVTVSMSSNPSEKQSTAQNDEVGTPGALAQEILSK